MINKNVLNYDFTKFLRKLKDLKITVKGLKFIKHFRLFSLHTYMYLLSSLLSIKGKSPVSKITMFSIDHIYFPELFIPVSSYLNVPDR